MDKTPLTPAQRRVMDAYAVLYLGQMHIPPTVREIAEAAGLASTSTTQRHLENIIEKGWLRRVEGMGSRGIVPTEAVA